ncbi:MAG: hypothetical protein K9K40_12650 [Desulfotignum sp.]|nr:hypothetical protein [Desulfotignum sp.]
MAARPCSILLKTRSYRDVTLNPGLIWALAVFLGLTILLPPASTADTRLGILPGPDSVLIRLAGQAPALVQEQRMVSLFKGINQVAFSWSGVRLDKNCILLTPLSDAGDVRILSTVFPPDGSSLIWEVYTSRDMVVPMVISYMPASLDHLITYTATVDAAQDSLDLDAHLIFRNFSGTSYTRATAWLDPGTSFTTDLFDMETRQTHFLTRHNLTAEKIHKWDGQTMPHDPKTFGPAPGIPFGYQITNTAAPDQTPGDLLPGKIRIYLKEIKGGLLFSGENNIAFLPKGDTVFLETGNSRDILVTKRRMNTAQTRLRRNDKGEIQVFDQKITDRFILENTSPTPASIKIIDRISGQWEPVDMGHAYTLTDHQTLVFDIRLAPEQTKTFDLTYMVLNLFADEFKQYNTPVQP